MPKLAPTPLMAGRVGVVYRVVTAIGVAIQGLGVVGSLDDRVGGDESSELWIVIPGAVVVEAGGVIKLFAGEEMRDRRLLRRCAPRNDGSAGARNDGRSGVFSKAAIRRILVVAYLSAV